MQPQEPNNQGPLRPKPEDFPGIVVIENDEHQGGGTKEIRPRSDDFRGVVILGALDRIKDMLRWDSIHLLPLAALIVSALATWKDAELPAYIVPVAILLIWVVCLLLIGAKGGRDPTA